MKALLIIYAIGVAIGLVLLVAATIDKTSRGARTELWTFGLLAIVGWPYAAGRRVALMLIGLARFLVGKGRPS